MRLAKPRKARSSRWYARWHSYAFALALVVPVVAINCSAGSDSGDNGSGANSGTGGTDPGVGGFNPDSGSGTFGDANCGSSTFANEVPGTLLLILDRSGSMSEAPDEGSGPSKWSSTVNALNQMMAASNPAIIMGLLPFPKGDYDSSGLAACLSCYMMPTCVPPPECDAAMADGGCQDVATTPAVALAPLTTSQSQISSWLSGNGPNGNTPTLYALKHGYDILRNHVTEGPRYALLITDGEPTLYTPAGSVGGFNLPEMNIECKTEADIEAEALAASNGNPAVSTFVIGSPGSEPAAEFLSQIALNGNTPKDPNCSPAAGNCHYQIGGANFEQELQAVLEQIAGVISDCIFDIPIGTEEVDPNKVNVVIGTENGPVEIYKDPSHEDGWDYTDPSQTQIQLFGPACELYKAAKGNTVTIILGCETIMK